MQLPPPTETKKNARNNTRFWGLKRQKKKNFAKKISTRRGVCLRCLDGYFCDISLDEKNRQKINVLINYYRSSVCLTAAVIFARLRWWGKRCVGVVYTALVVGVGRKKYGHSYGNKCTCCKAVLYEIIKTPVVFGLYFGSRSVQLTIVYVHVHLKQVTSCCGLEIKFLSKRKPILLERGGIFGRFRYFK